MSVSLHKACVRLAHCFWLVLLLARVIVTTGRLKQYIVPTEAVQIFQNGTLIHATARCSSVSPSTVSREWRRIQGINSSNSRRAGKRHRRSCPEQYLLFCATHLPLNTRNGKSTTGTLHFSQMRAEHIRKGHIGQL